MELCSPSRLHHVRFRPTIAVGEMIVASKTGCVFILSYHIPLPKRPRLSRMTY
jgi:hypothetical protein